MTVYNEQRLHSGLDYITQKARLEGRQELIQAELEQARKAREQVVRLLPVKIEAA